MERGDGGGEGGVLKSSMQHNESSLRGEDTVDALMRYKLAKGRADTVLSEDHFPGVSHPECTRRPAHPLIHFHLSSLRQSSSCHPCLRKEGREGGRVELRGGRLQGRLIQRGQSSNVPQTAP